MRLAVVTEKMQTRTIPSTGQKLDSRAVLVGKKPAR